MVVSHHFTRVDTLELKDRIYQKVGHQRAEKYFDQLKRFFCLKLSKANFDRSCIQLMGRENFSLHNLLIRSILQNACHAKIPPQKSQKKVEGLNIKVTNVYQRNCLQSLYGDTFPQSPRKCRSPVNRDRRSRDRPSPLGPLGKGSSVITYEEPISRIQEQQRATELHSFCRKPLVDVGSVEEGEEVEQFAGSPSVESWGPITAPLGILGNTRKGLLPGLRNNEFIETCQSSGELPDTKSLRGLLEKKLSSEEVGVSMDYAKLLNSGLDVFLKRLIEPCIGISESRCTNSSFLGRQPNHQMMPGLNGILPRRPAQPLFVSMLDFRVALESNPCVLGEDWPLQLEKICHYAALEDSFQGVQGRS